MAQQEKIYEKITDAASIITELAATYTDELWAVQPQTIEVLGITNKERPPSSSKLASIRPLKGATKALMQINNVNTRYIIELYASDWEEWSMAQKVAVIFHELTHVDSEVGKTVKHDIEDFRIMVDKLGVDWFNDANLPNLLSEKVEFDLSLRPNVPDKEGDLDTGASIIDDVVLEEKEETPEPEKEVASDADADDLF